VSSYIKPKPSPKPVAKTESVAVVVEKNLEDEDDAEVEVEIEAVPRPTLIGPQPLNAHTIPRGVSLRKPSPSSLTLYRNKLTCLPSVFS
jgi:hypothetical protein